MLLSGWKPLQRWAGVGFSVNSRVNKNPAKNFTQVSIRPVPAERAQLQEPDEISPLSPRNVVTGHTGS
jgi:hypothetical protein